MVQLRLQTVNDEGQLMMKVAINSIKLIFYITG